jgi:hypothetical protein
MSISTRTLPRSLEDPEREEVSTKIVFPSEFPISLRASSFQK